MRRVSKKAWLVIGVVAVLCISGGIIYAADYTGHFFGKFETDSAYGGIGMDRTPPYYPYVIKWNNYQQIVGIADTNYSKLLMNTNNSLDYYGEVTVREQDDGESNFAYAAITAKNSSDEWQTSIRADSDGLAYMKSSVGDNAVEVKPDGDVVITLGD